MRLKLISCEVFCREMGAAMARSINQVDMEFLPKGLHELNCVNMRERIQEVLDRVNESDYEAVLLGYGLCSNGLVGLQAHSVPLVVPRAHDCITLLLGDKERYRDYFFDHPGVYFKSSGWIERSRNPEDLNQLSIAQQHGFKMTYEELVAKYGEENAQYLQVELGQQGRYYGQLTFIEMGVEPDDRFERQTREDAGRRGWAFEKLSGDISLIQRMLDGEWSEREFLTVPPGWRIAASYDETIITAEKNDNL